MINPVAGILQNINTLNAADEAKIKAFEDVQRAAWQAAKVRGAARILAGKIEVNPFADMLHFAKKVIADRAQAQNNERDVWRV